MAREALKKIVVFGGNGFVGSEVLKRLSAVPTVQAISVSRRGAAPSHCAAFADKVDWRTGDCLDKKTYADALEHTPRQMGTHVTRRRNPWRPEPPAPAPG